MKPKTTSFVLSLLVCLLVNDLRAQNLKNQQKLTKDLQVHLDSMQKVNGFPGVTLSVLLPNNRQIAMAAGTADPLQNITMRPQHRMLSGSNGKTLFIAAALVLATQDYYQLDDKIEHYLNDEPWFDRLPNASTITMRMLMNHTSGLEEYYGLGNFMSLVKQDPSRSFTPKETFEYLFDRQPLFPAGSDWGYADSNYILLGYILEKISGKSMYDLVETYVLKRHKLKQTEPSTKRKFKNLAVGNSRKGSPFPFEGPMVRHGKLVFNPQFEWMGGGFVSNVNDLSTWVKDLHNYREIDPFLLREMQVKVPAKTGKGHAYGLGIQIRPSTKFGDSYGHSGWFPGYLTDAVYFPDEDIAVAIQFNTDDIALLKISPYEYILIFTEMIVDHLKNG
ncbi:serine hydrolase domain-containing protein [Gelidibacter sp. F63206]|uniref:serine hydrolase domain-containing protein n=1 Tax=Gelidibacter sp. F63206 TaxID=2926425 RepID=UPI001FF1DBFC|nr:serine hydrolase domain-containing protein [Gelidibacter sp. F63206]MCK0115272.1 beta-lactamase family protein [Gelidibacter sp. F63206]